MRVLALALLVILACSKKSDHPPSPAALENIPHVDAKLDPPPEADKIVITPHGVGALPLPLPKMAAADVNDEPLLVLTIARSASGGPQLALGATPVAEPDLERALRDSHRERLGLLIDSATSIGELATILAIVQAAIPDVRVVIPPAG